MEWVKTRSVLKNEKFHLRIKILHQQNGNAVGTKRSRIASAI